jgi:hypothetical protein
MKCAVIVSIFKILFPDVHQFFDRLTHPTYSLFVPVGLFHCGVGPSRDDRVIVVSIYRDGLSRVPGIAGNPTIPFRTYKPWACRKEHNKPLQITKKAREAIYQFIDQPGACLRDGIDSIDFESVENDDLSKTTPPGFEEGEWMLVDSPEKMRQCVRELQVSETKINCCKRHVFGAVLIQHFPHNHRNPNQPKLPLIWNATTDRTMHK